jgi:hypothetical protein
MRRGIRFPLNVTCILLLAAGCGGDEAAVSPADSAGATIDGRGASVSAGASRASRRPPKAFDIFAQVEEAPLADATIERPAPASAKAARDLLEAIRQTYDPGNVPEVLKPPFTAGAVRNYLETVTFLTRQRERDIAWLQSIDPAAITKDRFEQQGVKNRAESVRSRLEEFLPAELEHTVKYSRENLAASLNDDVELIRNGADADPAAGYDIANVLAGERLLLLRGAAIDRVARLLPLAEMFDEALGFDSPWPKRRQEIRDLAARYHANLHAAAASIVPPQDVAQADLTAVATRVLADAQYKLPKAERIIVHAARQSDNRRIDHVAVSGKLKRVVLRWDEFPAATIEQGEDGRFALYVHLLVYHHEAPEGIPLNQWTLGRRYLVAPILKENIGK